LGLPAEGMAGDHPWADRRNRCISCRQAGYPKIVGKQPLVVCVLEYPPTPPGSFTNPPSFFHFPPVSKYIYYPFTTYMENQPKHNGRRGFLKKTAAITALAIAPPVLLKAGENDEKIADYFEKMPLHIEINGKAYDLQVEPRVTLLDLLREQLQLTGAKKGCDHGQCGACTVHVNGRRINSCLSLAVMNEGKKITTIEGLAKGDDLHPMQEAFLKHDGFQCGYCTPGQIMSGIACIREGHANSEAEVREYMSGNICRCGSYPHIVDAIMEVKQQGGQL
jgi:xanthine dehydrogenase YagT iron-sulfur-binding subunit